MNGPLPMKIKFPVLLFLVGIFASTPASKAVAAERLIFGVFPYLSLATLAGIHGPLRDYLLKTLNHPVTFVSAPNFEEFIERTKNGEYDLVLDAPHMARLAQRQAGYQPIVTSRQPISGVILASNAFVKKPRDDRDIALVALPPRNAIVHLMVLETIQRENLLKGHPFTVEEVKSHDNALAGLLSGEFALAGIWTPLWKKYRGAGQSAITVLGQTKSIPGLIFLAHPRIGPERRRIIRDALLAFDKTSAGKKYFKGSNLIGFKPIDEQTMQNLDRYTDQILGN